MKVILGIDPGSRITGYGLIKEANDKLYYVDSGCIRTAGDTLSDRLLQIFDGICELIETYHPSQVAIEQVFIHQNPNSALKLGHARGVAMVAACSHRKSIFEYSAREVKQSLVGYGAASKDQVSHMVMRLLGLNEAPQADASDALAIAICHAHMQNRPEFLKTVAVRKKSRRWKSDRFLKG